MRIFNTGPLLALTFCYENPPLSPVVLDTPDTQEWARLKRVLNPDNGAFTPMRVVNMSPEFAYNVQVDPLRIANGLEVLFKQDGVIAGITPGNFIELSLLNDGLGAQWLYNSIKHSYYGDDRDTNQVVVLKVRYSDIYGRKWVSECDLHYKPAARLLVSGEVRRKKA